MIVWDVFEPNSSAKIYTKIITTPLGKFVAGASGTNICWLELINSDNQNNPFINISNYFSQQIVPIEMDIFTQLEKQLYDYFYRNTKIFNLSLSLKGTPFQIKVWTELLTIPFGKTITYKTQSENMNNPLGIRAIAHANGQNPIAIIIPCHRVIGSNGNLTGYRGGLENKKKLLILEGSLSEEIFQ
ncbi:MAG: methylated-DNA--[protein]-cysteine S-methyltransferase [Sediminibacterium sp.]|nr:methylated-DNA--[protein]-cysteine S-methyltransferase [Sediminibacterium sp.]